MRYGIRETLRGAATLAALLASCHAVAGTGDWPNYGNDPGGMRFSPLTQISRANVSSLKTAWVFHTGDITEANASPRSGFETTPLFVDETLYLTTPFNRVIALDPATGRQRWAFDPKIDRHWQAGDGLVNRGLATWVDGTRRAGAACHRRLYEATIDARLVAVDAATGAACADFGQNGEVSLRDVPNFQPGMYHMTSPPAVVDDVVVVGSSIDDNTRVNMPSGVVRAFDVRTGALRWSWNSIVPPQASGSGGATDGAQKPFQTGAGNAWSVMAVDPQRHLVFVPTGAASPDYFGGLRPGDNKWANSVVALRAGTGELVWGFQLVHHDLWDFDVAAPPLLATVEHDGVKVPIVVAGDKSGYLYVLNRETGKPVFGVEERPVPQSQVAGEVSSPTQPIPLAPPALVPQHIDKPWGRNAAEVEACGKLLANLPSGVFVPPSLEGVISTPGNWGGIPWSGFAFDPGRGLLIANVNNFPFEVRLIPRDGPAPARQINDNHVERGQQSGTPYIMYRRPILSPAGLPCIAPPWGTLVAVDLVRGTIRWQVPLGTFNLGGASGIAGTINMGGPIITAGGLAFVAGTLLDSHFRAFDVDTGKEVWSAELPAPGHATPMTYEFHGKQYVVIAASGHAKISEEPLNDSLVAFALP